MSEANFERPPPRRAGLDLSVAVPLLIVHVLGIGLAPFTFTRAGLVALVLMYLITGFGVTAGAHRLFMHRTYAPTPLTRDLLALAFLMSAQGSLDRWVRDHAIHHRYSDADGDPHSPGLLGFLESHLGWLWKKPASRAETRELYERWTKGLDTGRVGRFFRDGVRLALLHVGIVYAMYAIGAWLEAGFSARALLAGWHTGLSLVVWGVLLRIVLVMHSTFFVNSATHVWGSRPYASRDNSRNLWWVAVVALGEGWHNNHHARPSAANNGFHRWWELDLTFLLIITLGTLGLVRDVKVWEPAANRTRFWFGDRRAKGADEAVIQGSTQE